MRTHSLIGIGLGIVAAAGWLAAAGSAIHYRGRAEEAERQCAAIQAAHAQAAVAQPQPPRAERPARDPALAERDARIGELEALLDERDEQLRKLEGALAARASAAVGATNEPRRGRGGFGGGREGGLAADRAADPQAAEELARRREDFRQQVTDAFTERLQALKSRDTSAMSEEDRNAYGLLVQLIEDTWRLGEQVRSPDLPWEERRAVMEKLRANIGELQPMMDAERTREFTRIGASIGYDADQSAAFATQLNNVIETTSTRWLLEAGMRAAFGGGGRWGFGGGGRESSRDTGASAAP